jgi:hypothetical protein
VDGRRHNQKAWGCETRTTCVTLSSEHGGDKVVSHHFSRAHSFTRLYNNVQSNNVSILLITLPMLPHCCCSLALAASHLSP